MKFNIHRNYWTKFGRIGNKYNIQNTMKCIAYRGIQLDTSSTTNDVAVQFKGKNDVEMTKSTELYQQPLVAECPGQRVLSNNRNQRFSVDFLLIRTQNFY